MSEEAPEVLRYRAAGGVIVRDGQVLVLRRPSRAEVRLPKGHVEPGEDDRAAALREMHEETGLDGLQIGPDLGEQRVTFARGGRLVERSERFFLCGVQPGSGQHEREAQFEPLWLPWDEALVALTYQAEREWVRRAWRMVEHGFPRQRPAAPVRVALSTGSLYTYGVARVFDLAARAGFEWVEVLIDRRWDTRQADYLRRAAGRCGVRILVLHSPFDVDVPGWPSDGVGRLEHTVRLARQLSVETVVAHLPRRIGSLDLYWVAAGASRRLQLPLPRAGLDAYARFLTERLAAFEGELGVRVALENLPARRLLGLRYNAYRFNSVRQLARFRHLTLDTTHLGTWGLDPVRVYRQLRERIVHVHLSDYDGREHRRPGGGRLPLAELLQALARDRYTGTVSIEGDPAALDAEDESRCLAGLESALAFCQEHLTRE